MPHDSYEGHPPLSKPVAVIFGAGLLTLAGAAYVVVGPNYGKSAKQEAQFRLPDGAGASSIIYGARMLTNSTRLELNCPADNPSAVRPEGVNLVPGRTYSVHLQTEAAGQIVSTTEATVKMFEQKDKQSVLLNLHSSNEPGGAEIAWSLNDILQQRSAEGEQDSGQKADSGGHVQTYEGAKFATYPVAPGQFAFAVACSTNTP